MGAAAGDDKFYNGLVPASDWNRGPPHLPSHGSRGGKQRGHPSMGGHLLHHMIQPTIGRGIILVAVVKLQYEDTVSELLKLSTSNKVLLKVLSCWLSFHRLIATRKLQQGGRILNVMC